MAKKASAAKKSAKPKLATGDAVATIGVKSVKAARKFYEDKLGFEPEDARDGQVLTYTSGGSRLFVYESKYGGTNEATAVTWVIDDVDGVAASLKARGVKFEHYDMPGMKLEGDVHVAGTMRAAWFKDPDGNILAVVNAG
jgi:catechol 2,3-dioxygenase-like lactoylglutathione lyase family enzyme